jgi:hypothetical protein
MYLVCDKTVINTEFESGSQCQIYPLKRERIVKVYLPLMWLLKELGYQNGRWKELGLQSVQRQVRGDGIEPSASAAVVSGNNS